MNPRAWWILPAAVLVLASLAYGPSLPYPYLQDARTAVERNPVVERGDLGEIVASDYWKDTPSAARMLYRPVTVLSFAVERRLTGQPSAYASHAVNLALHAIVALLLAVYVLRTGGRHDHAAVAALLFTVHPVLLQGVVNVVGRADELTLLFGLASLLCLGATGHRETARPDSPAVHRLGSWGAAVCLLLALGSKEVAIAFPFLMLGQEALFGAGRKRSGRSAAVERAAKLAPSGIAVLVYVALRTSAIGEFPGLAAVPPQDNPLALLGGVPLAATTLAMAGRYLLLLLFPLRLSPDYSGTAIAHEGSFASPLPLIGLAFLATMVLLVLLPLIRRARSADDEDAGRRGRTVAMGALMFLLPYLVVGNVLVLNAAGFAERLLYVPAAGLCVVLAVALHLPLALAGPNRRRFLRPATYGLLAVLLVGGALQTRSQARMWESNDALMESTLRAAPGSLRANQALAGKYRHESRWDEAKRVYEKIAAGSPTDAGAWLDLGILLGARGDLERAESVLRRAISLDPSLGEAHYRLGLVLAATGRHAESERSLRRALLFAPERVQAAVALADLYYRTGRYELAARFYRGCVGLGRDDLLPRLRAAESRAARGN